MIPTREIAFVTLGCAKNEVDSDKMKARLVNAGFDIVDDPAEAAVTIVNTCSFLVSAVEEGLDAIFEVLGIEDYRNGQRKVLVAGCMPSRYGQDLAEELKEVAGFIDAADEERIVDKVSELLGMTSDGGEGPARNEVGASAYVKISDGCDRFCSYCMIPYIRGRYHSFPQDEILAEVDELVARGVREIVFIGQDTGIWGHDLAGAPGIDDLLRTAAQAHPEAWFRLLYLQPEGITDELLACMADIPNVCPYIDMPLQHADADVLRHMNRSGSRESLLELVERIRTRVPGITLRTTFIAGFPGETQDQFETLLDFIGEAAFDCAGVFPYSQEEGSKAATFPDQVPEDERIRRAQLLQDASDAVGFARTQALVGRTVKVLIEGYESTEDGIEALGRWQGQAPDVDGQVHIPIEHEADTPVGSFVTVHLYDSFCYELEGELV